MELNLPSFDIRVRETDGKRQVYDSIRRRYVALTPEEWVRQHFVNFLVTERGYPKSRIVNETSITVYNTSKRCDTVVLGDHAIPRMIVEYKAPSVEITQQTFEQIARYNIALRVEYLVVSNGLQHYVCHIDLETQTVGFMNEIPDWLTIIGRWLASNE